MNYTANSATSYQHVICKDLDISVYADGQMERVIEAMNWNVVSIQIAWKNLTGTTNGTLLIQQRNADFLPWQSTTLTANVNSANGTHIFENIEFGGESLNVVFDLVGITGGTVSIVYIGKRK
jgi:hypothetical protein